MSVSVQTRILHPSAYSKVELKFLSALAGRGQMRKPTAEELGHIVWGRTAMRLPASAVLKRLVRIGLAEEIDLNLPFAAKGYQLTTNGQKVLAA